MQGSMSGVYKERPEPGAIFRTDLPIPEIGKRDILLRVRAAAICGTDQHILPWSEYAQKRVKPPMVFGHEFAGDVVEVGSDVTEVAVGDRVAGETHIPCNRCRQCEIGNRHICENMRIIGVHAPGAFAEYISFPADCAFKLPDDIDYRTGSLLEPMGVAVHAVDAAGVAGKAVAVYGCGPIGLMAVGAAKAWGAKKVYAVDRFPGKLEAAGRIGADMTLDSRKAPASEAILSDTRYGADAVIDMTGNESAIRDGFTALRIGGTFIMAGLPGGDLTLDATGGIIYKEAVVIGITGRLMYRTWEQCIEILRTPGFDISPAVGKTFPLSDYKQAFEEIRNGAPGKMILLP